MLKYYEIQAKEEVKTNGHALSKYPYTVYIYVLV